MLSCSNKVEIVFSEESDLRGTWLLIEQYADPGDGSGDFRKVNSAKTIQIFANGTFTSNGSFCDMNIESDSESRGIYIVADELTQFSSENYLVSETFDFEATPIFIRFLEDKLVLSYLCIEGCEQKYVKR